nr:EscU/YscU/HrcU family type III secretion system export apparatus switch protein [Candidatus Wallbacteria bacterium]
APLLFDLSMKILLMLLILAIIDYTYQRFEFEKKIMMSKYDIKQEFKQEEGDPYLKQELRRRARKIATGQMMREVPKAKVIVTNPTHLSIAIAYEEGQKGAVPSVVAKGADFVALKIREIAKENGIPLYEHKPLARELYEKVEVGEEIPEEFFEAIATVFAFVYKQKGMINT